mmetsp:Transcript_26947/g.67115  ORF Transcript_26947/g.67115 Transcript_26947/m.67115 type:complete len:497 (-) Transcript_26947:97-1587(-)
MDVSNNKEYQKDESDPLVDEDRPVDADGQPPLITLPLPVPVPPECFFGSSRPRETLLALPLAQQHHWQRLLTSFQAYGRHSEGNRVDVLDDGDQVLQAMLEAICAARTRVWLESYIFDGSKLAERFVDALVDAAHRGCDTLLLIDYVGAFSIKSRWIDRMRKAGVAVIVFNPALPGLDGSKSIGPLSYRDHRKILIADTTAFCGSINISDDAGGPLLGNSRFYDVHMRLRGPCVAHLADVLRDSLAEAFRDVWRPPIDVPEEYEDGVYVQVLESNIRQGRRQIMDALSKATRQAQQSIELTTSYFYPPGVLRRALVSASRRGIPISILLSGNSDLLGDVMGSTHLVKKFLRVPGNQTRVHFLMPQHMHAKHTVVDGVWSCVGSFNWDRYSARRNLEVAVSIFDGQVASQLSALHHRKAHNEKECYEMTWERWQRQSPLKKLICWFAYCCVRLTGKNVSDGLSNTRQKALVRRALIHTYLDERAAKNLATGMMWGIQ